jgi:hypothetical membrane protein
MPIFFNLAQGRFSPRSLRIYLAIEALFFYGLVLACWSRYNPDDPFHILRHTFSYLGSFNPDRNPEGWWLFTIAMCGWGLANIPLALFVGRHLSSVTPHGAKKVTVLLVTGCVGIILVGLFPDARTEMVGSLRWTTAHYFAALVLVLGFLIGIPWATMLVQRTARDSQLDDFTRRAFQRARFPHVFFVTVTTVALFFLIRWVFVYENLKADALASGQEIGSSWREAMNTIYSFPLWDNVFVHTVFIYFAWTALALSGGGQSTDGDQ